MKTLYYCPVLLVCLYSWYQNMWFKRCLLVVLITEVLTFFQNDYHIKPEHITITWYNKDRLKYLNFLTFKYNRTTTAFNMTIFVTYSFSSNLIVTVEGYKFTSNEYRPFPINFQFNFCAELLRNTFGLRTMVMKYSNTTLCPLKKGPYYLANFTIDESKFPPYIAGGRYKFCLQMVDRSFPIANADMYAEVIPIEHYRYLSNNG